MISIREKNKSQGRERIHVFGKTVKLGYLNLRKPLNLVQKIFELKP